MSDQGKASADRAAAAGYLDALKAERAGYVQSGKAERIKAVDSEIARVSGDLNPGKSAGRAPRVERA